MTRRATCVSCSSDVMTRKARCRLFFPDLESMLQPNGDCIWRTTDCPFAYAETWGTCQPTWGSCVTHGRENRPFMSALLRSSGHIRYGRVEVVAKLPRGDWIWPGECSQLDIWYFIYRQMWKNRPLCLPHRDRLKILIKIWQGRSRGKAPRKRLDLRNTHQSNKAAWLSLH